MLLSREWLSEFVGTADVSTKDYCDRMTDTGSKVEGFETLSDDIRNVVVCKILSIEQHPDADKLVVCQIDDGESEPRQIVTGAKNMKVGDYVPVAKAPAELPGGVKIKNGKLRGVESRGMFCSIAELGLTLHEMPYAIEDGLLILNDDPDLKDKLVPGQDITETLLMKTDVVDFEITPNRPDCLSVIGLARETAASYGSVLSVPEPKVEKGSGDIRDYLKVTISTPKCPRYTARVVKNVKIAPSPLWLRMRLRAMGVRAINNIVDITNYVMLEYGQPMHSFDYKCLSGAAIDVHESVEGEKFISLDSQEHTLKAGTVVIADSEKPVALAGIMGGENSEISGSTETVVFESANFDGAAIRIASHALGMRTEASGRFEKNLDPENTLPAVQRACQLVQLFGAGEVVGGDDETGIEDVYPKPWVQTVLPLEPDVINRFLGTDIEPEYMEKALTLLGMEIKGGMVYVPSWREDVKTMNDLAEDIIRIKGYNTIEATDFKARVRPGSYTPHQAYRLRLCDILTSLGYSEIYTFSFISPRFYDRIGMAADDCRRESVKIRNPLGEDTSVMRTTLLPSMMEVLERNNSMHSHGAWLFEIANVYIPTPDADKLPDEHLSLSLGAFGDGADFYSMKGAVENILADAGIKDAVYKAVKDDPTFHGGRCADVLTSNGEYLGRFGEIAPDVAKGYGFDDQTRVYAGTVEIMKILGMAKFAREFSPLPKYPSIDRDFALICDADIESGTIIADIKAAGGKLVEDVKLFDVYKGLQLPTGKISLAYTVTLRAPDRTLTAEEAEEISAKIVGALEKKGIFIRK